MIDVDAVLAWGIPQLRDLPWRATREPWPILVAEVMLQQTQATRVAPRWESFLDRFPTPPGCASASLGEVLQEWHGLGYPRRARNLHLTARHIVERHAGRVPDDLASLLALPGVGPYTARAVLVFAHGQDVGVVETNIARVLARTGGQRLTPLAAQRLADSLVPTGEGLGVEPGADGPGGDVVQARAALRRVPRRRRLLVACVRPPGAGPCSRLGGRQHDAGPVRGK